MVPAASETDAESQQQQQQQHTVSQSPPVVDNYYSDWTGNRVGTINEPELAKDNMIDGHALVDEVNDIERYTGNWGHGVRYPWMRLPDHMCFRDPCNSDGDCCRRYNICDRSAHVCVDCWYGSPCTSETQCCLKYPTCRLSDGGSSNQWGQCVDG